MHYLWKRLLKIAFSLLLLFIPFELQAATDFKTDLKVRGDMDITLGTMHNVPFGGGRKNDQEFSRQRLRLWITAQSSEELSATMFIRIQPAAWGQHKYRDGRQAGFDLGADGVNLSLKAAWLNYYKPGSNFSARMGIIPISAPHESFFNGILFSTATGIELNYKFTETFTASFFWARLYNDFLNDDEAANVYADYNNDPHGLNDETDLFGFKFPINLTEARTKISPWGMYALMGKDSGFWRSQVPAKQLSQNARLKNDARAWWLGFAARTEYFDPFVFKMDFAMGDISSGDHEDDFNTRGWQLTGALDYKLQNFVPGVFGWYASGSDEDKVRKDRQWGYTPTIDTFGDSFNPTSFGFGETTAVQDTNAISAYAGGTWGFGIQAKDISFIEKLSHEIRFAYYSGSNDKGLSKDYLRHRPGKIGAGFLVKGDDVYETNFNHKYKAYENLNLYLNLGHIHMSRGNGWQTDKKSENAWQAITSVRYSF